MQRALISQKVFMKLFCKSLFQQKCVNLVFILVIIKDKLTDLCGNGLLQNDVINTFCEISSYAQDEREEKGLLRSSEGTCDNVPQMKMVELNI